MTTVDQTAAKPPAPRLQLFPGLRGVKREDMSREVIAGITLAALMIPLNIGYAQVAGLPPIVGLYTAIVPMIVYALFSSSRQLVAGPDAPVAALIGSILAAMAVATDPRYVQLAYALTLVCSVIFILFWVFKLGFLANFLSKAVLIGFVSGLGIEVLTSQIKKIMGVSIEAEGWIREVLEMISKIPQSNWYSVAIGIGTIVLIILMKRYAPRIPGALTALIVMTGIVAIFQLDQQGVSVLGAIPAGLPSLTIPQVSLQDYITLMPGAIAVCGVTLADALLVGRNYAQKNHYPLDANQQMFAFGVGNVAAGLTGGFVLGSSASRTASMANTSGSMSQIPSIVGAIVVAIVLLFFTDLLALLPNAALGGIVAYAVLSLIEIDELRELYRVRRSEFYIAFVCLATVLLVGSLSAVIIAFLFSILDLLWRAAKPATGVMGRIEGKRGFYDTKRFQEAQTVPGLVIYRFGAQLFFANSQTFHEEITDIIETANPPVKTFVLDAEAIDDIDTTGAEALEHVIHAMKARQINFIMARVSPEVRDLLQTYELFEQIGEDHVYMSNREATDEFIRTHIADAANANTDTTLGDFQDSTEDDSTPPPSPTSDTD